MENGSAIDSVKGAIKTYKNVKKILALFNLNALIVVLVLFFFIVLIGLLGGSSGRSSGGIEGLVNNLNLSATTLKWQSDVEKIAKEQGVPELVPYIMAIIEVESKGQGTDIMQSGESAGLGKDGMSSQMKSIEQGVKYLKNSKLLGDSLGFTDFWAVVQSYNFGSAYVTYLATNHKEHSLEVAENYSKNVVAPSLGNHSGSTYPYVNTTSQVKGKTYLYSNGGNYYYAELVRQYVGAGGSDGSGIPVGSDAFKTVMNEAIKYEGWSYSWGGANPKAGFDCSGLVQYTFAKAGISLPRVANQQWGATKKIDIKDAEAGDLIFFKGTYGAPDYISHVGIYVDETRMYDSNGSGIGYHTWSSGYWMSHFDSIRRVSK